MEESKFRKATIMFQDQEAGIIEETEAGYRFTYGDEFIKKNHAISVSLPTAQKVYEDSELFPFFVGLLPEGWYLDVVSKTLKIDQKDRFGILLSTCQDTCGAVWIKEIK